MTDEKKNALGYDTVVNSARPAMVAGGVATPAQFPDSVADDDTVTMVFPHAVSLNLDNYAGIIHFKPGIQEVPVSLKDHDYLKKNGVILYEKPKVAEPKKTTSVPSATPAAPVEPAPDLSKMTKAEIVAHAAEVHGLELDPSLKKDELIAAVEEHLSS